jgi:hypothetical protein
MSKFRRSQVYQAMEETGIIPVFYHADVEVVKAVLMRATKEEFGCLSSPTEVILLPGYFPVATWEVTCL